MVNYARLSAPVFGDFPWLKHSTDTLGRYNAWDVVGTALCYRALQKELQAHGQWEFYRREFWPLVDAVLAMQQRGLQIDLATRASLRGALVRELSALDQAVLTRVGSTYLNLGSDLQVGRLLFGTDPFVVVHKERATRLTKAGKEVGKWTRSEETLQGLGLRGGGTTEGGRWSVDRDSLISALRSLRKRDEVHRPLLHDLLHRSRLQKLIEYLEFDTEVGGRIRPRVKMYGTKTLRFAYADPPIHSWAKELRSIVAARSGHILVGADYRQVEARIAALLAHDTLDLAIYERGEDIHEITARECFSLTPEQWQAMSPQLRGMHRDFAKNFRYGVLLYGGQPETVKAKTYCACPRCEAKVPNTLQLSRDRLRQLSDRWFFRHRCVLESRERMTKQVREHHYLESPFGYRRYFFQPWGSEGLEREVYNWPIQHCAACIMNRAQVRLHSLGAPIILQHHDAFLLEVPLSEADHWCETLLRVMQESVPELLGHSFPIELSTGQRWGGMKEWKPSQRLAVRQGSESPPTLSH